jgi:hypothetical protein
MQADFFGRKGLGMTTPQTAVACGARRFRFSSSFRGELLTTVSALAMLVHAAPAEALCLGRCGDERDDGGGELGDYVGAAGGTSDAAVDGGARARHASRSVDAGATKSRNQATAAPSTVPNGLANGGLVPDSGLAGAGVANPVTSWVGANTPIQASSNGQTIVMINQTAPQALLNWQIFNVGAQTTVNFNQQGNANWVALNKIAASGVPSQILGSIRADGSV